MSRGIVRMIKR